MWPLLVARSKEIRSDSDLSVSPVPEIFCRGYYHRKCERMMEAVKPNEAESEKRIEITAANSKR